MNNRLSQEVQIKMTNALGLLIEEIESLHAKFGHLPSYREKSLLKHAKEIRVIAIEQIGALPPGGGK